MPKVVIANLSDEPRKVAIEPWADVEILPPQKRFEIEYGEPADLAFALMDQNTVSVSIMSEQVTVLGLQEKRTYVNKGY